MDKTVVQHTDKDLGFACHGGVDGVLIDLVVAEYRIAGLGDDSLVVVDSLEDDLYGIGFRMKS